MRVKTFSPLRPNTFHPPRGETQVYLYVSLSFSYCDPPPSPNPNRRYMFSYADKVLHTCENQQTQFHHHTAAYTTRAAPLRIVPDAAAPQQAGPEGLSLPRVWVAGAERAQLCYPGQGADRPNVKAEQVSEFLWVLSVCFGREEDGGRRDKMCLLRSRRRRPARRKLETGYQVPTTLLMRRK